MEAATIMDLVQESVWIAIVLSAIPLGVSMAVGFVVSVLQAATQIQEQTLSFVPKIAAISAVFFLAGGWIQQQLVDYTTHLFDKLPEISRMMSGPGI